jgi:hypothetical protein
MGGIQPKLLAAIEAGVKTVILPAENEQDVRPLPLPGPFAERRSAWLMNTRQGHQAHSPLSRLPAIRQSNQLPPAPLGAVDPADPPCSCCWP